MSSNSSVAVLLAAYNGIRWINEQVNSILNQKHVNVVVYISVDLSSDGTYEWCKELAKKNKFVKLLPYGEHFGGAAKNFFRLIKEVDFESYDYISLADQDDIWFHDKLHRAINLIKDRKLEGYSSNVIAFWKEGRQQLIKKSYCQKKLDYYFESAGPGCTFVLKRQSFKNFKNFLLENWDLTNNIKLHDWIIYAYYRTLLMPWYIDEIPSLYYRQHDRNEIGANINLKAYLNRLKKIKNKWYRNEVQKIVSLMKKKERKNISLNRSFLIANFYKLRRRPRDAFFLLLMNLLRFF